MTKWLDIVRAKYQHCIIVTEYSRQCIFIDVKLYKDQWLSQEFLIMQLY